MDYNNDITELKAKRAELEAELKKLKTQWCAGAEKLAIRQQIIAIDNQITACVNNRQPKTCGGLLVRDQVLGVVVNLRLFKDDPMNREPVTMFPVVDVVIDTGCNFTLILASGVFDDMVASLNLKSVSCDARVTNQQAMDRCVRGVFVQLPDLKDDAGVPLSKGMEIYRGDNHVSLFGLQALQLFRFRVLTSKEIVRWKSTFGGFAVKKKKKSWDFEKYSLRMMLI